MHRYAQLETSATHLPRLLYVLVLLLWLPERRAEPPKISPVDYAV